MLYIDRLPAPILCNPWNKKMLLNDLFMGVGRDIGLGKILNYKRVFIVNIHARTRCIAIGNHVTFSISLHNPQSLLLCRICQAVMLDMVCILQDHFHAQMYIHHAKGSDANHTICFVEDCVSVAVTRELS